MVVITCPSILDCIVIPLKIGCDDTMVINNHTTQKVNHRLVIAVANRWCNGRGNIHPPLYTFIILRSLRSTKITTY